MLFSIYKGLRSIKFRSESKKIMNSDDSYKIMLAIMLGTSLTLHSLCHLCMMYYIYLISTVLIYALVYYVICVSYNCNQCWKIVD